MDQNANAQPQQVDEEAYGMDCRPAPNAASHKIVEAAPDYIRAGITLRLDRLKKRSA